MLDRFSMTGPLWKLCYWWRHTTADKHFPLLHILQNTAASELAASYSFGPYMTKGRCRLTSIVQRDQPRADPSDPEGLLVIDMIIVRCDGGVADPKVPTPFPLPLAITDGQWRELALPVKGAAAADHLWLCVWEALDLQPSLITTIASFYDEHCPGGDMSTSICPASHVLRDTLHYRIVPADQEAPGVGHVVTPRQTWQFFGVLHWGLQARSCVRF
jgi:hypothetical protein